jgi:hypothetical protein
MRESMKKIANPNAVRRTPRSTRDRKLGFGILVVKSVFLVFRDFVLGDDILGR